MINLQINVDVDDDIDNEDDDDDEISEQAQPEEVVRDGNEPFLIVATHG